MNGLHTLCGSAFVPKLLVLFKYTLVETVIAVMFLIQTAFHRSFRLELLESQLSQLEQFDQALQTLTQRGEHFLSGLRSSSQVDIACLEGAISRMKVRNQYFAVNNDVLYSFCILE